MSLIVSSGAVERSMSGATIVRRLLSRDAARTVLAKTAEHRAHAALVFDRDHADQIVFESMDWSQPGRKGYFDRNRALISQSVPLENALVEDPVQVLFSGTARPMRKLFESVREVDPGVSVTLTEYEHRNFSLIDITDRDATKGHALAWRASQLGLDPSQVMAIGDNFNDVGMLEYAGLPVLMGNAVPGLLDRGWQHDGHSRRVRRGRGHSPIRVAPQLVVGRWSFVSPTFRTGSRARPNRPVNRVDARGTRLAQPGRDVTSRRLTR